MESVRQELKHELSRSCPYHSEESVHWCHVQARLYADSGSMIRIAGLIMQCLRIASVKAGDITSKIKSAVESYNTQRSFRKIRGHNPSSTVTNMAKHLTEMLVFGANKFSVGPYEANQMNMIK